jgi:hypothetical protein
MVRIFAFCSTELLGYLPEGLSGLLDLAKATEELRPEGYY